MLIDKEIYGRRSVINTAKTIKDTGCGMVQYLPENSLKS